MAQDTTPAIVIYRGNGDNTVPYDVPFDKGYYGEVKVAFIRRGLDAYTYEPDDSNYTLNGRLYAWANGATYRYTHTPNPAVGADTTTVKLYAWKATDETKTYTTSFSPSVGDATYDSAGVVSANTVSAVTADSITVDGVEYLRDMPSNIFYKVTAIAGQTITVDGTVYTRAVQHDIANQLQLFWTGTVLTSDDFICIVRDTERGQPYTFPNNQKHIENALDNLERQIQEVKDATDNALKVDPSYDIEDSHKMNPIEWLETIIRSTDKSVRALRYANNWLDYSLDDPNVADEDKTWNHLLNTENIKSIREQSYIVDGVTYYRTQYKASDGAWKTLADPHKWDNMKLTDLADTNITSPVNGQFIMFDGLKWKNVYSSTVAYWGQVLGNLTDQTDLMNKFAEYVRTDGTSVMTAPLLMRATESFKCAIAPCWDGVGFFKLNNDNSVTLMASMEEIDGLTPATNNKYNLGKLVYRWKNLYLSGTAYMTKINNGFDIAVPVTNSADTLALKSQVDLAANSGSQLYTTGVWYAKMYAATVVPTGAEYNGRKYADFSQTDSGGNPVIKIYTGASGAWTLTETITPPATYNGYITVTSKIWDIAEQSGQQGGQVLWDYTHKTFTPYPRIISFDNANITNSTITTSTFSGTATLGSGSTITMPATPTGDSIVNKYYVDNATHTITSIDAEIVGSLTVADNGDVSGISNNNYLKMPYDLNMSDAETFEILLVFTTGSQVDNGFPVLRSANNYSQKGVEIGIAAWQSLGEFSWRVGTQYVRTSTRAAINTKYYLKFVYDGTNYTLYMSNDGTTYTSISTAVASSLPEFIDGGYVIRPYYQTDISILHLGECYIKKDGIITYLGMAEPSIHQRASIQEVADLKANAYTRSFTALNTTVASSSGGGIVGTYQLGFTDSKIKLGLFFVESNCTQAGGTSVALATDVATYPCQVCGTNNNFTMRGCVMLPFINEITISFPESSGGVGYTALYFRGWM